MNLGEQNFNHGGTEAQRCKRYVTDLRAFVPLWFFLIFFFYSCTDKQTKIKESGLFDNEKYFTDEALRLSALSHTIKKTSVLNGQSETREVTIADWKKELDPFIRCNINKPAFRNSYKVDTVADGINNRIRFSAVEPHLAVRNVEIFLSGNRITRLQFATGDSNELYSTVRMLTYLPDSGYSVQGRQDMTMGRKSDYIVGASWK